MNFLLEYLYLFILEAFAVNFVPFATCYILIVSASINLGWKYSYNCLEVTISFPRISQYASAKLPIKVKGNDMSTTFLQQILNGRLLLVVIVGLKK